MENIIEVIGLTKDYDERTRALRGVSFEVQNGEWVSIMGPSGSGKTTLLNIIGCLDSASSGTVKIAGEAITRMRPREMAAFRSRNIGLVFQQYHLIPHLTALENVLMAQYFAGSVDEDDALDMLDQVGLRDRAGSLPPHLSGGEQQRVCIARALVNAPRLVLADEPTGNLDSDNGRKVLDLMAGLHRDGKTILMVTHSQEVGARSDRILRLSDARLVSDVSNRGKAGAGVEGDDGAVASRKAPKRRR